MEELLRENRELAARAGAGGQALQWRHVCLPPTLFEMIARVLHLLCASHLWPLIGASLLPAFNMTCQKCRCAGEPSGQRSLREQLAASKQIARVAQARVTKLVSCLHDLQHSPPGRHSATSFTVCIHVRPD